MTTLARKAYQAGWVERDNLGQSVMCETNAVGLMDSRLVRLLDGGEDRPEKSEDRADQSAWMFLDVPVKFLARERPALEAFEREHASFETLLPSLVAKYYGQFVAIHNGAPVDSDTSRSDLVRRFFEKFGDSSVYIGYVGEALIAYQLTPFRL